MLMIVTDCLRVVSLFLLAARQQTWAWQLVCFWYLEVEPPFIVIRVGDRVVNEGETPPMWASSVAPLARTILERKVTRKAVHMNGNVFRQNDIHFFHGCFFHSIFLILPLPPPPSPPHHHRFLIVLLFLLTCMYSFLISSLLFAAHSYLLQLLFVIFKIARHGILSKFHCFTVHFDSHQLMHFFYVFRSHDLGWIKLREYSGFPTLSPRTGPLLSSNKWCVTFHEFQENNVKVNLTWWKP